MENPEQNIFASVLSSDMPESSSSLDFDIQTILQLSAQQNQCTLKTKACKVHTAGTVRLLFAERKQHNQERAIHNKAIGPDAYL